MPSIGDQHAVHEKKQKERMKDLWLRLPSWTETIMFSWEQGAITLNDTLQLVHFTWTCDKFSIHKRDALCTLRRTLPLKLIASCFSKYFSTKPRVLDPHVWIQSNGKDLSFPFHPAVLLRQNVFCIHEGGLHNPSPWGLMKSFSS